MPKGLMRSLNTNVTLFFWIPAFAGMTKQNSRGNRRVPQHAKGDQREAAGGACRLPKPRRETRRGFGIGLLKPQVPGAAEETEGFRDLQGDRQGSAARGAKRR